MGFTHSFSLPSCWPVLAQVNPSLHVKAGAAPDTLQKTKYAGSPTVAKAFLPGRFHRSPPLPCGGVFVLIHLNWLQNHTPTNTLIMDKVVVGARVLKKSPQGPARQQQIHFCCIIFNRLQACAGRMCRGH